MNKYILIVLSVLVLMSCSRRVCLDCAMPQGEGYISVNMLCQPRFKSFVPLDSSEFENFTLILYKESGQKIWQVNYLTFLSDSSYWKNPAGNYVLEAMDKTSDQAEEGRGCVRLQDTTAFTIYTAMTTAVSLDCSPANAMLSVDFEASFLDYYNEGAKVDVGDTSGRSFEMNPGHVDSNAVYYNVGADGMKAINYTVTASNSDDGEVVFENKITLEKGTWTKVTFKLGENAKIYAEIFVDYSMNERQESETIDPVQ